MKTWSTLTIADLGKVVTGKTPPTAKPEQFGDEFPFVTPSDMRFGNKRTKTERFLSEQGVEAHKRIQLPKKAVCVVCIGATIGKVCATDQLSISNQQINSIIVDVKRHDPDFVFYLASLLRGTLEAYAGGAATPIVNKGSFSKIKLQVPELETQRKIAAILTAYDDLIEVNKHRIALLEKMAEELYREWFVRLRFPGYQDTRFVKGVPEEWEPIKIGERVSTQYGYTESANDNAYDPKFLRITDIVPSQIDWSDVPHCPIGESDEEKYLLHEGDIVVARTGATVGYAKRINKISWRAVFASYLVRLVPKDPVDSIYFGMAVESQAFKNFIQGFVTGAAQPQANATTMSLFTLYYPGEKLLKQFNEVIQPLFDQKDILISQVRTLTRTRDLLLPRLISGKLSVEDLDIQFPPSMQETPETAPPEQEAHA